MILVFVLLIPQTPTTHTFEDTQTYKKGFPSKGTVLYFFLLYFASDNILKAMKIDLQNLQKMKYKFPPASFMPF